ncbi:MAG: hypothetical protein R2730_13065 [Chitinophagales bacterium]
MGMCEVGCVDVWMCGCADVWIYGFMDFWMFGYSEVGGWKSEVGCRIFGKQRLDKHLLKTELSIGADMASEAINPDKDG